MARRTITSAFGVLGLAIIISTNGCGTPPTGNLSPDETWTWMPANSEDADVGVSISCRIDGKRVLRTVIWLERQRRVEREIRPRLNLLVSGVNREAVDFGETMDLYYKGCDSRGIVVGVHYQRLGGGRSDEVAEDLLIAFSPKRSSVRAGRVTCFSRWLRGSRGQPHQN